jgi:hypothetical protein
MATVMMSACGVLCSSCPAFHAATHGRAFQERVADGWRRIYGLTMPPEDISCGGCLGPDHELIRPSKRCAARTCCLAKGLAGCVDCPQQACNDLERAQSLWDEVPKLRSRLSQADFLTYAEPYCGHRRRLADARAMRNNGQTR